MTGVTRIAKLDFFIMKSQGISYLSLVAVIVRTYRLIHYCVMHYGRMVYRIDGY